jgi:choline dehydrogenase-like flavoprotein
MKHDVIIIGSGAGGSAAAYHLTQTGRRVLMLEKGEALPRDGSTLDVDTVMRRGAYLSTEAWLDRTGKLMVPEEHFNLGGKTKWYGAALLRFGAREFEADPAHACLPWPIGYDDLEPYYEEAERLLGVRTFPAEPALDRLFSSLERTDGRWRRHMLNLGLSAEVLNHPEEAAHFDGFASVRGLKSDAEERLLERVRTRPNLQIATGKAVRALLPAAGSPLRIGGVECEDGTRYQADLVLLAAGALHSPRLLQTYMEAAGLADRLPAYRNVGRNYKFHMLTAMLAFTPAKVEDVLSKTMLLTHDGLPHSTVQTLGGNLAAEILRTQAPRWLPGAAIERFARRAIGLFLQTEDGSHPDNRVLVPSGSRARPQIDHDPARLPQASAEHGELVRTLRKQLLRLGYLPVTRAIPITGTAHACGTLVTGRDPSRSVVDAEGRVHGMESLYVVDGSVLPRSSRVNPALTIYAWALRVASLLEARARSRARDAALAD